MFLLLTSLVLLAAQGIIPYRLNPNFQESDEFEVQYASPMEFEEIPLDIRESFTAMGCMIPQATGWYSEKHNIVSGEFAKTGQLDWIALCSRDGRSSLAIIWGGFAGCPPLEGEHKDGVSIAYSTEGYESLGYDQAIYTFPADRKVLYKMDDGLPKKRLHDSISFAWLGKAATANYCHEGKWIEFGTAD